MSNSSSVQVVVRLRPMNEKEKKEGTLPVISASTSNKSVTVIKGVGAKQARSQFSFDNVFTSFSNQQDVFSATLQPVISDVLKGFETCVFAYGQTGTGKTHTMEGDLEDPDQYGVIPRSAQAIFDTLDSPQYVQTNITCSYLEIYNEELSDLLVAGNTPPSASKHHSSNSNGNGNGNGTTKLDIVHGGKKQGVHCRGLKEQAVHSADDVLKLMQSAAQARHVGETRMNKQSSRSHCIFTMRVEAKRSLPDGSVLESQGKLHLVDLAGSESAKTAELKDSSAAQQVAREQERRSINKSLLTLGRVISMLKEQSEGGNKKSKTMIPYRDSKLTRILQEALGGRCKTVIIATISPSTLNVMESLQTLHYAQTANGIKNKKAVCNSYMSIGSAAGGIQMEMMSSSGDKAVAVERWQEMEIRMEHMQQEVEEARQALARNYMQQQGLEERADVAEKAREDMQFTLSKATSEIERLSNKLEVEIEAKEIVTTQLRQTEITLTKITTVLKATQQTEQSLTSEALVLLRSLKDSVADGEKLYSMVQSSHNEEVSRRSTTRDYHQSISVVLNNAASKLDDIVVSEKENISQVGELVSNDHVMRVEAIEEAQSVVAKIASLVSETSSVISQAVSNDMVPKLDSFAAKVESHTKNTREIIIQGDAQLSSSCSEALGQLESFVVRLCDMDEHYSKLKDESLSNVEEAILKTKSNVETMLHNVTASIQAVRERSAETRADLIELIEEWTKAGFVTAKQVKVISSDQLEALENMFNMLQSEMTHHESVNKELVFGKELLSASQASQRSAFDSQSQKILIQKRQLDDALESHESLCDQVMATVMDGVKDLVTQQLKLIVTDHAERNEKLVCCNNAILEQNDDLSCKSSTMLETLSATNTKLQSHAKAMQQNDDSVLITLIEGRKALVEIDQVVDNFHGSNTTFDEQARGEIVILESIDETIGDAEELLTSNGQACLEQIEASAHNTASESISLLGEAGSKALAFAKDDIVRTMSDSIAKIEEPRKLVVQQASKNLKCIQETTQAGLVDVTALTKQNVETIIVANENVNESVLDFTSTRSTLRRSQCDKSRKEITHMLETHERAIQNLALACKENIMNSKEQTSTFGDVVKMEAEVASLPSKSMIEYSEALSSTPDEADVFKGIDFGSFVPSTGCSVDSPSTAKQHIMPDKASPSSMAKPDVLRETSLNCQTEPRAKSEISKISTRKRSGEAKSRMPKRNKPTP